MIANKCNWIVYIMFHMQCLFSTLFHKYWEFLFTKSRASTFSAFRQFLSLVTVNPAVEKSFSVSVEVAGMQRIALAF